MLVGCLCECGDGTQETEKRSQSSHGTLIVVRTFRSAETKNGEQATLLPAKADLKVRTTFRFFYRAKGSGLTWNLTILLVVPLPPSMCHRKLVP